MVLRGGYEDKPINQAQHWKYLGVLIDANLNFKQQARKSLFSNALKLFNNIPNKMKDFKSVVIFKTLILELHR